MTRVCVLIGEGKSEKAFFSSLLLNQLDFEEVEEKNCITYCSKKDPNLFWIFPIPSYGASHKGGYKMLQKEDSYITSKVIVRNNQWRFGTDAEIVYCIVTDTDNKSEEILKKRLKKMDDAILKAKIQCKSYHINLTNIEIESWFMAGLALSFPSIADIPGANKIIGTPNAEIITNPKEALDQILEKRIAKRRQIIGRDFGEYLNFTQARAKSKSFSDFINFLIEKNLLII
jgi:hypothetical protein